ncbi:unnamed protein product [Hydatigera taeniaeformis]|uniref:Uncharacterized protein n=1 Tax=Hydatigena taeniaeformis TaxID=6205 RepID=A0A0R3X1Z5_HYDTA|nr:unnamed protein product [Hydatigera taeniaeformis]
MAIYIVALGDRFTHCLEHEAERQNGQVGRGKDPIEMGNQQVVAPASHQLFITSDRDDIGPPNIHSSASSASSASSCTTPLLATTTTTTTASKTVVKTPIPIGTLMRRPAPPPPANTAQGLSLPPPVATAAAMDTAPPPCTLANGMACELMLDDNNEKNLLFHPRERERVESEEKKGPSPACLNCGFDVVDCVANK